MTVTFKAGRFQPLLNIPFALRVFKFYSGVHCPSPEALFVALWSILNDLAAIIIIACLLQLEMSFACPFKCGL